MPILSVQNLAVAYGDFDVFSGLTFAVPEDARIGLVGPNGVGKTTLMQTLAGVAGATAGTIHLARDRRVGYLRQEAVEAFAARDHTVYAEMLTVFADIHEQADALRAMEGRMADGDPDPDLLEHYSLAQARFEHLGGYHFDLRIEQVLEGLGFPRAAWDMPLHRLSGGQKTRALLARLLLEAPDLLILDEPTNHLDMQAIEWLEATLRAWSGALLLVSHDRYFLDRVVDRVWEMSSTGIEIYRGTYSAYTLQREERWLHRQQLYEDTRTRLEEELELIRRYIAWRKFDEANGRLKRLSRELLAIAELGIEGAHGKSWSETGLGGVSRLSVAEAHQRIRALQPLVVRPPRLKLRLRTDVRGGSIVLRTGPLAIGYPGKPLFTSEPIELHRQECAALIGPNGVGKTTFLRTILGQIPPLAGSIDLGANLRTGYFAQAHESLDPRLTVLGALLERRQMPPFEARNHLAQYLFRGEDVQKRVGMLSGGERGRLALALLALEGANFLLLDEPTNHLDIPAQEVLQEGLEQFDGTLLLVSHDRYLVDRLATQIWDVRGTALRVYPGPYQEYQTLLAEEDQRAREAAALRPTGKSAPAGTPGSSPATKEARRRAQALARIEDRIAQLEARVAGLEGDLQRESEAQRYEEVRRLSTEYAAAKTLLDELMESWLDLAEEDANPTSVMS